MLKDDQNCSYVGGVDTRPLKTWSYFSLLKYKYDSFSFQLVIFLFLFIVMVFTFILLVILNSNLWLCLILVFCVYGFKISYYLCNSNHFYIFILHCYLYLSCHGEFFFHSTMSPFHCHCCWLLVFVVFFCFLVAHECNHLLGLLITLEVPFWAVILSLYIIIITPL